MDNLRRFLGVPWAGHLLMRETIEQEWVIDKLLPPAGRFLVVAPPKTGKSLLVMQLAHCAALGLPFIGFDIPLPMVIHYIDGEMGPVQVRRRLIQMEEVYPEAARRIFITMFPSTTIEETMMEVSGVNLFIVDPAISIGYDDENSSATVRHRLDEIHRIAMNEFGAPVVLVHHTRKSATGVTVQDARGSGAFIDWVDGGMTLMRDEGGGFKATFISRGAETPEPMTLVRDPETLVYEATTDSNFGPLIDQAVNAWKIEYETSKEPPTDELVRRLTDLTGLHRATVYRKLKKFRGGA